MSTSPSLIFSATLPVKPSQTITSATPEYTSRPSTLPMKLRLTLQQLVRLANEVVPLVSSSPIESSPTRGCSTPSATGVDSAHGRELQQVLRPALDIRAGIEQHRRRRSASGWSSRAPADRRQAAGRSAAWRHDRGARMPALNRPPPARRRRRRPRRESRRAACAGAAAGASAMPMTSGASTIDVERRHRRAARARARLHAGRRGAGRGGGAGRRPRRRR